MSGTINGMTSEVRNAVAAAKSDAASFKTTMDNVNKKRSKSEIWAEKGLIDWKFADVRDYLKHFEVSGRMAKIKWFIAVILALNYLWSYVANGLVIASMTQANETDYAIAFGVVWGIEIIAFCYDAATGWNVYSTDDVSDSFQNSEASRFLTIRSFADYCFITKVRSLFTWRDKIVIWHYTTLRDWKRLVITVAQLILALVYYSKDYDEETDTSSTDDDDSSDDTLKVLSLVLKIATCGFSCILFCIAFLLYPCLRCYVTATVQSLHLSVEDYCSLEFDIKLSEVMKQLEKDKNLQLPKLHPSSATTTAATSSPTAATAASASSSQLSSPATSLHIGINVSTPVAAAVPAGAAVELTTTAVIPSEPTQVNIAVTA